MRREYFLSVVLPGQVPPGEQE